MEVTLNRRLVELGGSQMSETLGEKEGIKVNLTARKRWGRLFTI